MPSALKVSELIEFLQQSFDPDHRIYIYHGSIAHVPLVDPRELFTRENNTNHIDLGSHVRAKLTYSPINVLPADQEILHAEAMSALTECRQIARRYLAKLETTLSEVEIDMIAAMTNGPIGRVKAANPQKATAPTPAQ